MVRVLRNKLLVFLVAVVYSCAAFSGAFADNKTFSTDLTDAVNRSIEEWMKDDTSRALITVLLTLDLMLYDSSFSIDDYSPGESVIARTNDTISVAVAGKKNGLLIFYTPALKYAQYTTLSSNTQLELYAVLQGNSDSTYLIDANTMAEVVDLLGNWIK